jgi:O-antigen ligase
VNAPSATVARAFPSSPAAAGGGVTFSGLGFAAFLALLVFAQIDAVGNRLFGALLPVSLYSALYLAAAALALCAWAGDRGTRLVAVPAHGVRVAAALLAWAAFAWTLSRHGDPGWEYLKGFAKAAGLLGLAALLVDTPQRLRAALWAMVGGGIVSALIVYGDSFTGTRLVSSSEAAATASFGGIPRSAGGSDENPTTAAHMLLVSTALLLGLFAAVRSLRIPAGIGIAICLGALALMAARSALIGLLPAVLIFLFVLRRERAFPLILLGVVALVVAAIVVSPALLDRLTALADWGRDPTLVRRTTYLAVGFDLLQQSPVWGIGPGNFPIYFVGEEYRFLPGRTPIMRELHNTYLDVAVELGLVGLLLFLALVGTALAEARRALLGGGAVSAAGLALVLALVALLVASFFMPNKDMRYLWLLLGLAFQAGRLARARRAVP